MRNPRTVFSVGPRLPFRFLWSSLAIPSWLSFSTRIRRHSACSSGVRPRTLLGSNLSPFLASGRRSSISRSRCLISPAWFLLKSLALSSKARAAFSTWVLSTKSLRSCGGPLSGDPSRSLNQFGLGSGSSTCCSESGSQQLPHNHRCCADLRYPRGLRAIRDLEVQGGRYHRTGKRAGESTRWTAAWCATAGVSRGA